MITKLILVLKTCWSLGLLSVARVAVYRVACKCGIYQLLQPVQGWSDGDVFFTPTTQPVHPSDLPVACRDAILLQASSLLKGQIYYFSHHLSQVGSPPDWFLDPISGTRLHQMDHWSKLNEFSKADIKIVWEASRFEWAPLLARAWRVSGDTRYLDTLNNWLYDWVIKNPANQGPNWKCGQEASIRTINLLLTALLVGTHRQPSSELVLLIQLHCSRILPTIHYALAQDNNHGTSEAAALYIGGVFLLNTNSPLTSGIKEQAKRWHSEGRRLLENRVRRLVADDGSFSQYSVNYHRVLIDTLCQVELWRKEYGDSQYSEQYLNRCCAAIDWLRQVIDTISGNAPNFGANDGAKLYSLTCMSYRDFRPSVQLASVLFNNIRTYPDGCWDEPLHWFGLNILTSCVGSHNNDLIHSNGGDVIMRHDGTYAMIRFANFRFRPNHADCLHFDLWHSGNNILRDAGTYSYNTDSKWLDYFSGTRSHNTVQFDDRNQMPRLGRFLFAHWVKMDQCSDLQSLKSNLSWSGAYTDWKGARHRRSVTLVGSVWRVVDEISGYKDKAVLRWRLQPAKWDLCGTICDGDSAQLSIITDAPLRRLELCTGWESLYYQLKTELPVLEIEVPPGSWNVTTEISLKEQITLPLANGD